MSYQSDWQTTTIVLHKYDSTHLQFSSQVTVWGDYGRLEGKKVFMGVAQIMLDQLDLSKMEIGWYKLFGTSALVNPAGLSLSRRSSLASLDSIKL